MSRAPCPVCGVEYNPPWMTRHVTEGYCLNPTREQLAARERQQEVRRRNGRATTPVKYPRTALHRQHLSDLMAERMRERHVCPDCGNEFNRTWLVRHKQYGRCAPTG